MTKEEFDAISSVEDYLRNLTVELFQQNTQLAIKCFVRKEIPVEDYNRQTDLYLFILHSHWKYSDYYLEVHDKYYDGLIND